MSFASGEPAKIGVRVEFSQRDVDGGNRLMWDGKHTCPHCGAEYTMTYQRFPMRDADTADCYFCGKQMAKWNDTSVPLFKLEKRPKAKSDG